MVEIKNTDDRDFQEHNQIQKLSMYVLLVE